MTIPTRPAPAPPQMQNATTGTNAPIDQLRHQLAEQHRQQQQNGSNGMQKLTIKLPPPPKVPGSSLQGTRNMNSKNNNFYDVIDNNTSITRKFPKARYAPSTDWEDSPFAVQASSTNGNSKKIPPPRPPPPRVQINGRQTNASSNANNGSSTNMLTSLFQRKKISKITNSGLYSRNCSSSRIANSNNHHFIQSNATIYSNNLNSNTSWPTMMTSSTMTLQQQTSTQEAQLISFDSPPSSPTFTQKSNSDCVSVDSFSSDSNFSSPQNGSVSQPESGFEDDFSGGRLRSRPTTTSPLDPWEAIDGFAADTNVCGSNGGGTSAIGTAPVRNLNVINTRLLTNTDNPLCNGKNLLPPASSLTAPTIIKPKISQKPKAPKPPLLNKSLYGDTHISGFITLPSPPMPQCAPPPPPSASVAGVNILDVISGKVDALLLTANGYTQDDDGQPFGIALYDFEGVEVDDLRFKENEKVYLLEKVSDEWYRGRTRSGCEGIFPGNYIDVKVPLTSKTSNNVSNASADPIRIRCLYNFPAEVDGDLALRENDIVHVIYRINEDWLYGECNGKQGQFPANFLEYIPKIIPLP